jgi:two-component sensor histidine kinase
VAFPASQFSDLILGLPSAIVAASNVPLLLLDHNLAVIAASTTFCNAFQLDPASVSGRQMSELGAGEWSAPQLQSLLTATISGDAQIGAYEFELKRPNQPPRRLVINAKRVEYGDAASVVLLVTVADVTDARIAEKTKDDLLREKAILLQELQHRVANSLQIIASVLLQNARTVQSEETRSHLKDAHQRVMSVAAIQQQLATSTLGQVELRPYFDKLCKSIGASMIRDHNLLTLEVSVDESTCSADMSISLGLIVTELVINALKHAFPGHRSGKIVVAYRSVGPDWTLSVSDNGVGMPTDSASAKPGLGTSIVDALANQLKARVQRVSANPGYSVSIIHP